MSDLYKLDIDFEGSVTLYNSPVQAMPLGLPIFVFSTNPTDGEKDPMKRDPLAFNEEEAMATDYIKAFRPPKANVYDFMPAVLGNKFRTNEILSRMLLRRAPETAPFMLLTDAYEELGLRYAGEGSIIPALECYRIALQSRTSFARAMGLIQGKALHDEN